MLPVAVFVCLGWILSVCLHEFGHALVAYWGGDTSVKDKGYLTLNPLKYTNLNLSLLLPLLFLLMGGIALPGAAVYIDRGRLRNRWWQSAVSAAGPIASIIVTLLLAIPFQLSLALRHTQYWWIYPALACLIFLQVYVTIINSLPIPSLDGYGVIEPWLPRELQTQLAKYSSSGLIFLFVLLMFVRPINLFIGESATTIAQFLGVPSIAIADGFGLFQRSSSILLVTVIGVVFVIQRLTQKSSDVWLKRGIALSKSRQYEKAIAAYDQAIRAKPEFEEAWHNRGLALYSLNRFKESIDSYDRVIQINPSSAQVWYHRGLALYYLKQYEEAIASYDRAVQIQPEFALGWQQRASTLSKLHRYEEAVNSYDKLIQIQSKEPGVWSDRSDVLIRLQRYEAAIASCEQALKLKPDYNFAWLNRGFALEKMQRFKEASDSYEKIIRIKPGKIDYDWSIRGYALGKLKRYSEALAACDKAIQINPKHVFAWYSKACCYAEQNKISLAIEHLKKAIELSYSTINDVKADPSFDLIRNEQMFKQLIDDKSDRD